jgi:hypothetical protein
MDPGWVKKHLICDEQPGSYFGVVRNNLLGYNNLIILCGSGMRSPGWKKF